MQKRKRSEKFINYLVTGIFTCILIALGSLIIMMMLPMQINYEAQSLATAQYLEQYPAQAPDFIRINENCASEVTHCFWLIPNEMSGQIISPQAYQRQVTLRINGQTQNDIVPTLIENSLYVELDLDAFGSGLHLLDISWQDDDGQLYQHTWSARIDISDTTPPPTLAVPPTYSTAIPTNED